MIATIVSVAVGLSAGTAVFGWLAAHAKLATVSVIAHKVIREKQGRQVEEASTGVAHTDHRNRDPRLPDLANR